MSTTEATTTEGVAQALMDRVLAGMPAVSNAVLYLREPSTQLKSALGSDPLTTACQNVARIVLAAELLAKAAAEWERIARDALAECFDDTGSMGVRIEGFTVTPSTSASGAVITGEVPPKWMTTPAPAPDKGRITKALRAGEALPFAVIGNGRPTVSFRTDKTRTPA